MGGEAEVLAAAEEACRVYVGNLVPKAKETHLQTEFARFGVIHNVWIARRKTKQQSKSTEKSEHGGPNAWEAVDESFDRRLLSFETQSPVQIQIPVVGVSIEVQQQKETTAEQQE
ncbi:hypothetical protein BBJ28_00012295 [Nothophytophthora sp. Chile5]|nr:hypothetical protein BBJ28_00012295 [Nothophytophthora sp. Chile5]